MRSGSEQLEDILLFFLPPLRTSFKNAGRGDVEDTAELLNCRGLNQTLKELRLGLRRFAALFCQAPSLLGHFLIAFPASRAEQVQNGLGPLGAHIIVDKRGATVLDNINFWSRPMALFPVAVKVVPLEITDMSSSLS